MDDKIYTSLMSRSSTDSKLFSELQMFSDEFSVVEFSTESDDN